ncbi:MAG: helix-turn-helix transcriptional regulator [Kordiimonadaceae bacterium]|nr:helix-turn-helix transcriptional regulator [Kordiimonadaceae bacterium]
MTVSVQPHPREQDPFFQAVIRPIIDRRMELGLTQVDLDNLVGYADGLTAKYEVVNRRPSGFHLWCICEALHMTIQLVPEA